MKLKSLFKTLSGLAISSSLFPVVISLNRTHTHTQDSLNVGNLTSDKNDEVEAEFTYEYDSLGHASLDGKPGYVISEVTNASSCTIFKVPETSNDGEHGEDRVYYSYVSIHQNNLHSMYINSYFILDANTFINCPNIKDIYLNYNRDYLTLLKNIFDKSLAATIFTKVFGSNVNRIYAPLTGATVHIPSEHKDLLDTYKHLFLWENDKGAGLDANTTNWDTGDTPTPTPTPTPETHTNIWAPLMGGIFGGIVFSGLTTGTILVIKNKRNKDKNK